jgi:hypothetical protein
VVPTEDPSHVAPYLVLAVEDWNVNWHCARPHITLHQIVLPTFLKLSGAWHCDWIFNVNLFRFKYIKMPFLVILKKFKKKFAR